MFGADQACYACGTDIFCIWYYCRRTQIHGGKGRVKTILAVRALQKGSDLGSDTHVKHHSDHYRKQTVLAVGQWQNSVAAFIFSSATLKLWDCMGHPQHMMAHGR